LGPRTTRKRSSPETSSLAKTLPLHRDLLHRQIEQVAQAGGGVVALVDALDAVEHLGQHVLHLCRR
jgi:hypothetical protein